MTYFEDLLDAIHFTMCLLTWREQNVLNYSTLVLFVSKMMPNL